MAGRPIVTIICGGLPVGVHAVWHEPDLTMVVADSIPAQEQQAAVLDTLTRVFARRA